VSSRSIAEQFLHDMKASWQKTALLAALFVVGLFFWVPPLIRMVSGGTASPSVAAPTQANVSAPTVDSSGAAEATAAQKSAARIGWKDADEMLATDPLVQSAEVAAIQSKPFQIDHEQFPPPVLFAEEDDDTELIADKSILEDPDPVAMTLDAPNGLVLKSTIVGATRRAAFINSRLYYEGKEVRTREGAKYLVTAIYPRRVVLTREQETYELTIVQTSELDDAGIRQE
jgi:hypothetical protein